MIIEFTVNKTGLVNFDAAHAYGLCLLLALITEAPVQLIDEGPWYHVKSHKITRQMTVREVISNLLAIPNLETLKSTNKLTSPITLPMSVLDGLLAVRFTSPGARTVSVHDMYGKAQSRPAVIDQSISKISAGNERLIKNVEWLARQATDFTDHLVSFYQKDGPAVPVPTAKREYLISIPMTIEPALSYSTRRPISDGMIGDKHNLSFAGALYAPILAIIGAAHFLRAHRVAEDFVLIYLPISKLIAISVETALPILKPSTQGVDQ